MQIKLGPSARVVVCISLVWCWSYHPLESSNFYKQLCPKYRVCDQNSPQYNTLANSMLCSTELAAMSGILTQCHIPERLVAYPNHVAANSLTADSSAVAVG
jgi:hypothetical protein